jgi:nitrogen-specific signal transduction histidine kinase/ActR/RegA family two-component response regulator
VIGSRDISARRAAEAAILDSQARLAHAQKLESIGRLASGVAHDFNNLLTAMRGHLELMRLEPALSASARTRLDEVVQAVESGARLTGQLLAFARREPRSPAVFELDAMLRPLVPLLARLLGENVEVRLELGAGAGRVCVDRGELEQVVANLAVNARDAMPRGGKLTLTTTRIAAGEEPVSAAVVDAGGDWLALAISDTGCGICEEARAHLFEPFFTTKPPGQGTGLGLAMVRDLVTRSGGRVAVDTTAGEGTTFTILLPRIAEAAPAEAAPPARAKMQGGSEVILLVEDSPLVRDLAAELLGWLGYRVLACATGEEALEVAADGALRIDLLLTDVVLPRMNGSELAERLCAQRAGLRVLFTSGYTDDVLSLHGAHRQPLRFLAKPYTPQTLAAKIREALADR